MEDTDINDDDDNNSIWLSKSKSELESRLKEDESEELAEETTIAESKNEIAKLE